MDLSHTYAEREQRAQLEKFKQSINQWVSEVPDLTTPHYNKYDDLMKPEAYDEIRELVSNDLLPLRGGRKEIHQFHEYPFYENWQIDRKLDTLIYFTQVWVHRRVECPIAKKIVLVCHKLRNIIENNLPFTVFYLLSNKQSNFRSPYTHSTYEGRENRNDWYVMRPEEKHLFGIIVNQDSKIKQLEERMEYLEKQFQNISDIQHKPQNNVQTGDLIALTGNPFDDF